jgi:hypothetical protein
MLAKLYWFPFSHPSQAVRQMLELKGVPYKLVTVLRGTSRSTCASSDSAAAPCRR